VQNAKINKMKLQDLYSCLHVSLSTEGEGKPSDMGRPVSRSERHSNIELLRLLCMFFILVHHFITHALFGSPVVIYGAGDLSFTSSTAIVVNGLCYVGVNCFLLITGYFGLRFKWKRLLNIYFILVFYSLVYVLIEYGLTGEFFGPKYYLQQIFSLKYIFSRWWFMECYVLFFLIAPLIKTEGWSRLQYQKILVLLTIVNIALAYWLKRYSNGFTVAQFLYLYVVGGYIRRFVDVSAGSASLCVLRRWGAFGLYLGTGLLFGFFSLLRHYMIIPHWNAESYNNPLLVLSALGLFLFMLTFNFQSRIVNWLASSSLAIYLVQHMDMMRCLVRWSEQWIDPTRQLPDFFVFLLIFCLAYMLSALLIDQVRKLVFKLLGALFGNLLCKLSA